MSEQFERLKRIIGENAFKRLRSSKVAVFGIGGVGGYVCEALARSGIGHIMIIDNDTVDTTNLNRQIIALHSTIGRKKTEVMEERLKDIDPDIEVIRKDCFYLPENSDETDLSDADYIVDAVDTVAAKTEIITQAKKAGRPVISCMGTGNKTDPSMLRVADISKTKICPLAKVMRKQLRDRGIDHVKVVYSEESPVNREGGRIPGSTAFVPSSAGLMIAAEIVKELTDGY
ncbi:MAG: tRNA threonylcarbamoyladenosine dehydratase [Firmicutes bacterium]|nr:tRNA threonylcarbamoyladenosine dehydratase [Bacillota bacterium]